MARKNVTNVITEGASAAAGFAAGRLVAGLPFFASNPYLSAGAQIGAGVVLSGMRNKMLKKAGAGAVASGIIDLTKAVAPGVTNQLGLSGVGYSAPLASGNVHAVAGYNYQELMMD